MDSRATPPPATIGRFRVDAVLGSGGMGEVYKAFDPTLKRTVAVKTVRPDLGNPEYLQRLFREAQACARLRHPNVVTVYEAGELDGVVYIAMEYLTGEDLSAALKRGALTFEAKLRILIQILNALQHAHSEDVIHRDIKPSNVHLQPDGSVKLVDFGLARVMRDETVTISGTIMGTPDYASPEQLKGESIDRRTDIYSTGALAYEMVTGRRPFHVEGASLATVILKVISEPLPPMNVSWSRSFPQVEQFVTRAMAKLPASRFQTAEEMRHAIEAFLASSHDAIARVEAQAAGLHVNPDAATVDGRQAETLAASQLAAHDSKPAAPPETAPTTERTTVPARRQAAAPSAPASSNRMLWWTVAAAVILVVAGGALFRLRAPAPIAQMSEPQALASSTMPPAPPASRDALGATAAGAVSAQAIPQAMPPAARVDPASATASVLSASATPSPAAELARDVSAKQLFTADAGVGGAAVNTGLRYRLVRRSTDNTEVQVDSATTTFRSGDRVRFVFDSNIDGYLYVVQQGSSGRWTVLFPGPQINGGKNAVRRAEQYRVPSDGWFAFDSTPGKEQVFVYLSREPLTELPGFDRPVTKNESVVASVIEELQHRVRSRDLVFEKDTTGASPGGPENQATYIVNRAQAGSAVATNIELNHDR